jgi:cytosine/adenosine deaminase-related metal-dependent hydrolase
MANMNQEDIYWGALLGIAEMIKSGTTTYADMYIHMDQIAQAVYESGIRASGYRIITEHERLSGTQSFQQYDRSHLQIHRKRYFGWFRYGWCRKRYLTRFV